jgi:poly-gamma-glutamate synthesis protein (capsule biosynthesis protein)
MSDLKIRIIAVGDVSFAGDFPEIEIIKSSSKIEKIMLSGDIIFCNLESPLTSEVNKQKSHYSKILNDKKCIFLKSSPTCNKYLQLFHFNVVSLANNHIMDYLTKGLIDTIENLRKVNINHVGAGKNIKEATTPFLFKKNGVLIGLLAFSYTYEALNKYPGCAPIYQKLIIKNITELRAKCDIIIISLHFGEEFSLIPEKSEIDFCHSLVNSGANVILGHHPHVVRLIENYRGGIIAYSLGSFIFDPKIHIFNNRKEFDDDIRGGIILQLDINPDKSLEYSTYSIRLNDYGLPKQAIEISSEIENQKNTIYQIKNSDFPEQITEKSHEVQKKERKIKILAKIVIFSIIKGEFRNIVLLIKRAAWRHL